MLLLISIFLIAFAVFLMSLLLKLLRKPIKWVFKLICHALMGYVALFVFNFVGAWVGLNLPLTGFNAVVTGILGVPGVVLLLLVKYLL